MNLDLQHPNFKILFYFWSRSEYRHSKSEFQFLSSQKKKKKNQLLFLIFPPHLSLSHIYIYIYIIKFILHSVSFSTLCFWRAFTPQYYDKFLVFISLIFKSCYTRIQYNLFLFLLIPSCRFFFFFLVFYLVCSFIT